MALSQSVLQQYLAIRLETAQGLLKNSRLNNGEIALTTRFSSPAGFAEAYGKKMGTQPSPEPQISP
jgi:transcriptional regulator GlxA family with amidase domain